ncbi:MAG TPA: hypothetical protein PKO44_06500 [Candidatus Omnitrophota bacterium]|nr:hypothetical protein [Candidatus Omnitrophota bacterium]
MAFVALLTKILHKLEVDRAVFFGLLARLWSVIFAPVTILLIASKFSPELQGYYYTFASLLALQVFVELGLGIVVIQFASHEWSKLKISEDGSIIGDKNALSRLRSLANITSKWYAVGALIVALGLGLGGYIFFQNSSSSIDINWVGPWFSLCFFTAGILFFVPAWSLLEGCNQVADVYFFRFFQGIISSLSIWIAILLGAKLWTASISTMMVLFWSIFFLGFKYLNFIKSLFFNNIPGDQINWRKEIFPMQWRIALSWISGYFIFSIFTPIIFRYHGSIVAGQFGMTWSIASMVATVSGSWIFPKAPKFGMLIAEKRYVELDILFWKIIKIFITITVSGALAVWLGVYFLNKINHPFSSRILPLLPTTIFLIAQVTTMLSLPFSVYMRAHKKEPIFLVSIAGGLAVGGAAFLLGKYSSIINIALGYLAINLIIFPIILFIWNQCRLEWHLNGIQ